MSMSWPTLSTFCAFYIVKNLIEFGSHWIHIIPGLFMNLMRKKKTQVSGIRSLDPYLVKLKRYHLRYLGRYRQVFTSRFYDIEKIIKIEITNNSNV